MSRTHTLILSTLIVTLAILTGCGSSKEPSAQINATAVPDRTGASEYPEQNLKFTAPSDNVLPLRVHLLDNYCSSFRASIKVKRIDDTVAAQNLKTAQVKELDMKFYKGLRDKEGNSMCEKTEGNLDVKLVPGTYVLMVNDDEAPVYITVLTHKS